MFSHLEAEQIHTAAATSTFMLLLHIRTLLESTVLIFLDNDLHPIGGVWPLFDRKYEYIIV